MIQRRNGSRLAVEALFGFQVLRQVRRENLDRDGAVEPCIACPIHLAHPASA
jgi:hypothetical protein